MAELIYEKLKEHWEVNEHKYFKAQDIELAGKEECEQIYMDESVTGESKNLLANGLLELILELVDNEDICNVEVYLSKFPLIQYYFAFVDKLKIMINEGVLLNEQVVKLGKNLVKESNNSIIKLGLALLKFGGDKESLQILKVFSNHNEYIFYSIEGLKEYDKCNSIIFDIAKASRGYGKLFAVTNLEVLSAEIKKWIIEHGCENDFLENVLAIMTYNEQGYFEYFIEENKSKRKYNLFTKNLMLLSEVEEYFNTHLSVDLIMGYYEYFKKYDISYESLYVMTELLMLFLKEDGEVDLLNADIGIEEEEGIIKSIIEEFLAGDYKNVIKDEINKVGNDKEKVIKLAIELSIDLKYTDFKDALNNDPYCFEIYNYIISEGKLADKRKILKFANNKLPFDIIANKAENICLEEMEEKYLEDKILYVLLDNMEKLSEEFMDINIKALKARCTPVRFLAFNNLKALRKEVKEKYIKYIEEAVSIEIDKELKLSMRRFLENDKESIKERRYENVSSVKVLPHVKDIFLTKTIIAGTRFRDLTIVENKLNEGEAVFLKREKENLYDENAIMVLTENGYLLGYIARKENYILKNLMDWGKVIYGNITKISEDYSTIEIELYLSYIDVMKEVSDTFNMVTENPVGYLN